jgi:hypothetical protein
MNKQDRIDWATVEVFRNGIKLDVKPAIYEPELRLSDFIPEGLFISMQNKAMEQLPNIETYPNDKVKILIFNVCSLYPKYETITMPEEKPFIEWEFSKQIKNGFLYWSFSKVK